MKKKSLKHWIKTNRKELDARIGQIVPDTKLNDYQRRLWVLGDEGLYLWARGDGVNVDN